MAFDVTCVTFVYFQSSLQLQQQEKDNTTQTLRSQITNLHDKLQRVGETEVRVWKGGYEVGSVRLG